ncbi:MAG: hypothetical protein J6U54_07755 [Clostridiales bacterium]|nr:hypothetical protein [Clostridiales bacterium]
MKIYKVNLSYDYYNVAGEYENEEVELGYYSTIEKAKEFIQEKGRKRAQEERKRMEEYGVQNMCIYITQITLNSNKQEVIYTEV